MINDNHNSNEDFELVEYGINSIIIIAKFLKIYEKCLKTVGSINDGFISFTLKKVFCRFLEYVSRTLLSTKTSSCIDAYDISLTI